MQRALVPKQFFSIADLAVILLLATVIYGVVQMGSEWQASYRPFVEIDLSFWALPRYTMLSAFRGLGAYLISLIVTLVSGYLAAKSKAAERIILPLLDIGQSIPVLGFLPGLVIGLIALFPHTNVGLELAAILAIFTSQVWNMAFSFYNSVKSVPADYVEATTMIGMNWWEKLKRLELPFSAVNLAWNSVMSMAGGWFFLSVSEAFTLGDQEFRLPGIGAYMAVAVNEGNNRAIVAGVIAMVVLIVAMDFFLWRPVLSWVQRFRIEDSEAQVAQADEPLMSIVMRESRFIRWLKVLVRRSLFRRKLMAYPAEAVPVPMEESALSSPAPSTPAGGLQTQWRVLQELQDVRRKLKIKATSKEANVWLERFMVGLVIAALAFGAWKLVSILLQVNTATWILLIRNTFWTLLRVFGALILSTLWTVPAGIWLGVSFQRLKVAQPIIQVLASFPAPMLFPLVAAAMLQLGIGLGLGSMLLMMMGVQWYILFNVLAGAQRIPVELSYALRLMRTTRLERWKSLYLPSVFPSLVTGWVIAAGGAWNTSIVAEYVAFKGTIYQTQGLGSMITVASATKDFPLLAASLTMMVVVVIGFNRTLWAKLYSVAQTRFRMDL